MALLIVFVSKIVALAQLYVHQCYSMLHALPGSYEIMATADEPMEEGDEVDEDREFPHTPERQTTSRGEQEEIKLYHSPHLIQVPMSEYRHQATEGTQQAVRQLKFSPEFKMHTQQCHRSDAISALYFGTHNVCTITDLSILSSIIIR